ncbi:MAG: PadR family transcriptional regulator [Pseudoclavibacter sp.]
MVTTLYATIDRVERECRIAADGDEVVDGRTRKYFRITDTGVELLAQEVEVLEHSAREARVRLAKDRTITLTPIAEAGW